MQSRVVVDIDFTIASRQNVLDIQNDLRDSEYWKDAVSIKDDSEGLGKNGRHVYVTLHQAALTREQQVWLNDWSNGDGGGIGHYDVIPISRLLTIREYLTSAVAQSGWQVYYKDCRIDDVGIISEQYVHIVLQLPRPVGGTVEEVVNMETVIEYREEGGQL